LTGTEWYSSLDLDNLDVVERGAVRSTVRVPGKVGNTHFSMDVVLYENLDYFDVSLALLWNGERNRQVRMVLPFNIEGADTLYGCPFGSVQYLRGEMEGTYRGSGVRFIQNWMDLSNSEYGITIGADHGCFDLGSEVATVCPVLLRTAFSCGDHHLWYENKGERTFRFRFQPHSSDWRVSLSQRIGDSLNILMYNALVPMPMVAYYKEPQEGFDILTASELGELGEAGSLVTLDCGNVLVSAIVKDELRGWNMRLYETDGQSTQVTIEFAQKLQSAEKVDFLGTTEEYLKPVHNRVVLSVSPYEICQVHFELGDQDD
jgi:alpha-mannosidase